MRTRKSLLLSAGVIAIVALLAVTEVFAQVPNFSSCTSKTTSEGAGNFTVNVAQQTQNGRTIYTYSVNSPTGKNPNKIFFFVMKGLNSEEGFTAGIPNPYPNPPTPGAYLTPHQSSGFFPPAEAWRVVHHEDGVGWMSIAIDKTFQFNVKERPKPEESLTTVLLGVSNTFEHCGPILGATAPPVPEVAGSPVLDITARVCFNDGCCYFMTAGATDNIVKSVTPDPETPVETVCGSSGCQACTVTYDPGICEQETGIAFCPPLELGRPPIQGSPGGTCYAPPNRRFPC